MATMASVVSFTKFDEHMSDVLLWTPTHGYTRETISQKLTLSNSV